MTIVTNFETHPWELVWIVIYSTEKHLVAQAREDIAMGFVQACSMTMQALREAQAAGGVTPTDGTLHVRAATQYQDSHQPR